jgi:hypothetical protein
MMLLGIRRKSSKFRNITPREAFRFQGFPDSFILPPELSNSALYHQAGNSVVVPVVRRIAERIILAMSETDLAAHRNFNLAPDAEPQAFLRIELE